MRWQDLLGYDAAQLKALTNKEIEEIFAPCLHITRPDRAPRADIKQSNSSAAKAKRAVANDILGGLGFDLEI